MEKSEKKSDKPDKPLETEEKTTKTKQTKYGIIVFVALIFLLLSASLLINFTNLKYKTSFNPISSVVYSVKSAAANGDVERANFHISESERLVAEVNKSTKSGHTSGHVRYYKKMISHNEQATQHMLAAEASGVDLNEKGLIERLCDSLGEQYALINNININEIAEEDKLANRVNENNEDLRTVFDQIQGQLEFAMSW